MSFSMPIAERAQVAAAEGVAGLTQHVEYVTSVGPWSLRRGSSSSWTAISSPGARTRRGTITSTIGNPSARMDAFSSNPFSDAFAASLDDNNLFRDRNTSEASSSTAVDSGVAAAGSGEAPKPELTRTIEEVDRQAEEVRQLLSRERTATNHEEADGAVEEVASGDRQPVGARSPEMRLEERSPPPTPQHPQPAGPVLTRRAPATNNVEREAVEAFHELERGTVECLTCKQHANVASVGLWLFALTCVSVIASMTIFLTMEGKYDTKLFQGLLGFPFAALWSVMFLAGLALLAMKSPAHWGLKGGWQFFRWWGCSLVIAVFLFYLVVGLIFKFGN